MTTETKDWQLDTVPCKWCDQPTTYTATQECDPCHNVSTLAYRNPELAKRIVDTIVHLVGELPRGGFTLGNTFGDDPE